VGTFAQIFNVADEHVNNEAVVTFGGGIMLDLTERYGVRGDLRVFRSITQEEAQSPFVATRMAGSVFVRF
jgi:hypothetical protein